LNLNPNKLLSEAVIKTRNAETAGFEDLYLLTWQNTYTDIRSSTEDEEAVWSILRDVYIEVWNRKDGIPEAGIIRPWIRVLIKEVSKRIPGRAIEDFPSSAENIPAPVKNLDDKAATVLILTEEKLGLLNDTEREEREKQKKKEEKLERNVPIAVLKIILASVITAIAVFAVIMVVRALRQGRAQLKEARKGGFAEETDENAIKATDETEETSSVYGWNETAQGRRYRKPDGSFIEEDWLEDNGSLYYFDNSGFSVTGDSEIDGQEFTFSEKGAVTGISRSYDAETKDTILSAQMKTFGKDAEVSSVVRDSVKQDGDWIYYLQNKNSTAGGNGAKYPTLMRFRKNAGQEEIISENVSGYVLQNESVWYAKDGGIVCFAKSSAGRTPGESGYTVSEESGKFCLLDNTGNKVSGQDYVTVGDRIYRVADGTIKYVKPAPQSVGSQTFLLNSASVDNKIYLSGGSVYLEQGKGIDCLCAVGNKLYYSAIMEIAGSEPVSQIWSIDVDTKIRQAVTGTFSGRMMNMYYYSDKGSVYMEYVPGTLNSIYGRIAVLTSGNELVCLNDSSRRAGGYSDGNDMLELIWVSGDEVDCYWHNCSGTRSSDGTLKVLSTSTLKLSDADREPISVTGTGGEEKAPEETAEETVKESTEETRQDIKPAVPSSAAGETASQTAGTTESTVRGSAQIVEEPAAPTENEKSAPSEESAGTTAQTRATVSPVPSANEE